MNFDLTAFGFFSDDSTTTSAVSARSASISQSSVYPEEEEVDHELAIPSYDTPGADIGGFDLFAGAGTSSATGAVIGTGHLPSIFDDELAVADDLIFDVDDDGILRPVADTEDQAPDQEGSGPGGHIITPLGFDDMLASERLEPTAGNLHPSTGIDDDNPFWGDEEPVLPTAGGPVLHEEEDGETELARHPTLSNHPSDEPSTTAEAPQQRGRRVKVLRPDQCTELSNKDLNAWNENYLLNMQTALRVRQQQASISEARKYAGLWSVGQGLGRVAFAFGNDSEVHPLAVFSGESLWEMLRDRGSTTGTKRSHSQSQGNDDSEEERRVRARPSSQEDVARGLEEGNMMIADADDGVIFPGDELHIESEVGRHAPPSLQDHSSGMPWNISASRQSSTQPLGSGLMARLSSSIGGIPGGMELGPPSALGRRGSRLASASPLLGRGLSRLGSQDLVDPSLLTINDDEFADLDQQLGADIDVDFELYGPSATVNTQIAQQSQWVTATLENEAYNFLTFVQAQIREGAREQGLEEVEAEEDESVSFSNLLPPEQHSRVVAAQGLLHVLALATKGLLQLYQGVAFGEIEVAVVGN